MRCGCASGSATPGVAVGSELEFDGGGWLGCGEYVEVGIDCGTAPIHRFEVERGCAYVVDGVGVGDGVKGRRNIKGDVVIDELTDVGEAGRNGGIHYSRLAARCAHQAAELTEKRLNCRVEGQFGCRPCGRRGHVAEHVAARGGEQRERKEANETLAPWKRLASGLSAGMERWMSSGSLAVGRLAAGLMRLILSSTFAGVTVSLMLCSVSIWLS